MAARVLKFGPHVVTNQVGGSVGRSATGKSGESLPLIIETIQVWYTTNLSMCLVNIKPLLPGHVLVCPIRGVQHVSELRADEVTDLFMTIQRVSSLLKTLYKTSSVNIGISDGVLAGQSVPHVHAHVIPRQYEGDYDDDALYGDMAKNDSEWDAARKVQGFDTSGPRPARTDHDMAKEAAWLRTEMTDKDSVGVVDS